MSERDAHPNTAMLSDAEKSIAGMTPRAVVFKLAEAVAVARRRRSWAWIGAWMAAQGVKPQRSASINPRALANYLTDAKRRGLVDGNRVNELARQLDERVRALTLEGVGAQDALRLLVAARSATGDIPAVSHRTITAPTPTLPQLEPITPRKPLESTLPSRWSRITPPALD